MDIHGTYTFNHPQAKVWNALTNPEVIAQALPGVQQLTPRLDQPLAWDTVISLGFIGISASFGGHIAMSDLRPPDAFQLVISGGGTDSRVMGTAHIQISPNPDASDSTTLTYAGAATVTGTFDALPQSMVKNVVLSLSRMFFGGIARHLDSTSNTLDGKTDHA
jgi:carbon monoxide dehydrogenase subunit G